MGRSHPRITRAAVLAGLLTQAACGTALAPAGTAPAGPAAATPTPATPTPVVPTRAQPQVIVDLWLTCIECSDGELAEVATVGPDAVPLLEDALADPSSEVRAALQAELSKKWQQTTAYLVDRGESPGLSESQYVQTHVANFAALIQMRAAFALGVIHTTGAEMALQGAMAAQASGSITYRPDVAQAIQDALNLF